MQCFETALAESHASRLEWPRRFGLAWLRDVRQYNAA